MSLASVLATMTYKPTYTFEIIDVNDSKVLEVTMHTHDSRPDEAPPLSIPVHFPVPDITVVTPGGFDSNVPGFWYEWLREKIEWCELHESAEWLRFDGELYSDPHKEAMFR